MDLAMLTASVENQLTLIKGIRTAEQATRDAVSNTGIEQVVKDLFPGVSDDFIKGNRNFPNVLQRGANRYVSAVTRAELNWEWAGEGDAPDVRTPAELLAGPGRDLLQAATVDALCCGKYAFFPYRDEYGRVQISALSGFLFPIFSSGNSTVVEALLQITATMVKGKPNYTVHRYSPGMLEIFSDLEDWTKYATVTPQKWPQSHAKDRLPVAFRITGRDANRQPEGLAATALPAFLDYVKARVLMAFVSELGSFEERVFYSDELYTLAKDNPNHPLLKASTAVGPRKGKFLPSGDKYERLESIDLTGYQDRAREAAENVDAALNIPPTSAGADLAGVALQELRENYTETSTALTNSLADGLTEAVALAAAMNPSPVDANWRVTLKPRFTQDTDKERAHIREDFKATLLPKSAALSGLQGLGVTYVTDEMVQLAEAEEALDTPVVTGG